MGFKDVMAMSTGSMTAVGQELGNMADGLVNSAGNVVNKIGNKIEEAKAERDAKTEKYTKMACEAIGVAYTPPQEDAFEFI